MLAGWNSTCIYVTEAWSFAFLRVLEKSQWVKQLPPEARGWADQGGKEEDCGVRGSTEGKADKTVDSDTKIKLGAEVVILPVLRPSLFW